MLTGPQVLKPTKRFGFFWTVRTCHRLFFKMNLDIVGTHNVNTITVNGNVSLLLLSVSLILTFDLLALLEGHLNGVTLWSPTLLTF